jgi:hypothetical protein
MDLTKLTIEELSSYEKVARVICAKYENATRNYAGSIIDNAVAFEEFEKYNKKYQKILAEIEKRLEEI